MTSIHDFIVVFDAMGVLYSPADDVRYLLIPYLKQLGSPLSADQIQQAYQEASLGHLTVSEFWLSCGVAGDDLAYCSRHTLTPGMLDLLADLTANEVRVACLSNDVSQWARCLRQRFHLSRWIQTWVISSEIGVRKPDPAAFAALVQRTGVPPNRIVFFDDKLDNVRAARTTGIDAVLFTDATGCRKELAQRGLLPVPRRPGPSVRSLRGLASNLIQQ